MSCQSNSSIVVKFCACRFLTRQMTKLVGFLLFLCSFLVNGPNCWRDVSFSSPVRILNAMYMLQGKLRFHEMIHGGSCLRAYDLFTNFGLPLFEAWAYQLKKIFVRRTRVCGLIMPDQGEFYIIVFHWRSVKPTLMSRGDIVEARLEWLLQSQSPLLCLWCAQRCRYTPHMNLCQCSLFSAFRLWREYCIYYVVCA